MLSEIANKVAKPMSNLLLKNSFFIIYKVLEVGAKKPPTYSNKSTRNFFKFFVIDIHFTIF